MTTVPDDPGARYRAALTRFAEQLTLRGPVPARPGADPVTPVRWPRGPADLNGFWPRSDTGTGLSPRTAAAEMALVVYPGPVGELVHREIHAHLGIGHRFGEDALIPRLVAHLSPSQKEEPTDG